MNEEEAFALGFKKYCGKDIDVYFNLAYCTHSGICVQGDCDVFCVNRRPWILPDEGDYLQIVNIINNCPSKALMYRLKGEDILKP